MTTQTGHDFGWALHAMRGGQRVYRHGWNGMGMWLALVPAGALPVVIARREHHMLPFIVMRTAQQQFVPWLASQTDLLSMDWDARSDREES